VELADPSLFDRRSMTAWASQITVLVFISGAMEDEQTGLQRPALLSALPKSTPVYANLVNSGHIDSTDPQIISRRLEFLDPYVADKVPTAPTALDALILDDFTSFTSFAASTTAQAHCRPSASPAPARSVPATPSRLTRPASPSGHRPGAPPHSGSVRTAC
jgi:hypothetical protein